MPGNRSYAQSVPDRFGNNPTSIQWVKTATEHFKIVFPSNKAEIAAGLASDAEQIYEEYKNRLGTAPSQIVLYYNDEDELVSASRAKDTDDEYSIWNGNPYNPRLLPKESIFIELLRAEVAYAFQEHIEYFPIDYYYYIFSNPSKTPWSDGFVSYLAKPEITPQDVSTMRSFWFGWQEKETIKPPLGNWVDVMLGRSQMSYYEKAFSNDSLNEIYTNRQSLLGLVSYFDLNTAFKEGSGISYDAFENQWENELQKQFAKEGDELNIDSTSELNMFPEQKSALIYRSAAIYNSTKVTATIVVPKSGSFLQELRIIGDVVQGENSVTVIDKGYFHPKMDWHPAHKELAYAKREYGNDGNYYNQLYIWNAENGKSHRLMDNENIAFPSFSPEGDTLVYVEKTDTQNIIWIQNVATGSRKDIYAFSKPLEITQLDFHPHANKILVSYCQDRNTCRAGILNIEDQSFADLELKANISLDALWNTEGNGIYFNSQSMSVVNIFMADLKGINISNIKPISSQFYGTELWDVAVDSAGSEYAVARKNITHSGDGIVTYNSTSEEDNQAVSSIRVREDSSSSDFKSNSLNKDGSLDNTDLQITPYNAFWNTQWEVPFFLPYYLSPGDFGLAAYAGLQEPMRSHEFNFYGTISLADPLNKSFFYSEYVNNTFRPQLEFKFNHFPSASGFFGNSRKTKTTDVFALTSLWKLTGWSRDYTDWYVGLTFRHLKFDYFPETTFRNNHPDLFLDNNETNQTDITATITWRNLKPNRHNLIHPVDGRGLRFSVSAAEKTLGSDVQYARFSLDGYTILPAIADHKIYLHGAGVLDTGEPAGRDYLSFSDNGNYKLPGPDFTGSVNPGKDRFVRGYTKPLVGERFLFGSLEYRIPFQIDTKEKLLGFIPPARTSLTFFADGGVMGEGRTNASQTSTVYRYSAGAEVKRVFSIGGSFKLTYELGLAQPLNKSLSPEPYFNVKTAIPF